MSGDIRWIKITTDMFEDEKIDFISSLPEADAIIVIWIRILALAGKCNAGGYVLLTEKIPYTEEMLAHKFKKPLSVVKLALETFRRLEMLDMESNVIFLPNWEKHQNIEAMEKVREYEKLRKAKQREKKKQEKQLELPPNSGTSPGNVPDSPNDVTGIEVDIELDLLSTTTTETTLDVYRKVFGQIHMNGLMTDYVTKLIKRGYTEVFIKEVMYEVGESGTKPSLNYMKSIAERWIADGIYTRAEAKRRHNKAGLRIAQSTDKPRTKQQLSVDREIAFNRWVESGGDPSEFVFEPTA